MSVTILILLIGGMMISGHLMGGLFKKLRMPELGGIVLMGVLIEIFILYILKKPDLLHELLGSLHIVISIALGLEAFSIGSEMTFEEKDEHIKTFPKLLILQLIFASVFTLLSLLIIKDIKFSILIGAIAAATAPITLLELSINFKKDKKLTRGLARMISFDNITGILYFFIVFSLVGQHTVNSTDSYSIIVINALLGLLIAAGIGIVTGLVLFAFERLLISKKTNDQQKNISYIFIILSILLISITGTILINESKALENLFISEFMVTFIAGMVFGNLIGPKENHRQVHVLHNFIPPLLTVFFVIVGMELDFTRIFGDLGIFLIVYIVVLVLGKMLFGYLQLSKCGVKEKFSSYTPFGVITKSSFEIYLAHLAMISFHNDGIFIIIITSIVIFETLEPILLSNTILNKLDYLEI